MNEGLVASVNYTFRFVCDKPGYMSYYKILVTYPLMVGQVSLDVRAKFAAYQA